MLRWLIVSIAEGGSHPAGITIPDSRYMRVLQQLLPKNRGRLSDVTDETEWVDVEQWLDREP